MQEAHGLTKVQQQIQGQDTPSPIYNFSYCSVLPSISRCLVTVDTPPQRSLTPRCLRRPRCLGSDHGSAASSKPGCFQFLSVRQGNINTYPEGCHEDSMNFCLEHVLNSAWHLGSVYVLTITFVTPCSCVSVGTLCVVQPLTPFSLLSWTAPAHSYSDRLHYWDNLLAAGSDLTRCHTESASEQLWP